MDRQYHPPSWCAESAQLERSARIAAAAAAAVAVAAVAVAVMNR